METDSIHLEEERRSPPQYEAINWQLVEAIRQLSLPEKNKRAFAAADFALRQKKLLLAEENPNWTADEVAKVAHRLVFGVTEQMLP
jgi:hypothetical protein